MTQTRSNNAVITFPTPTSAWTTPTYVGIWSAETSGTFYGSSALTGTVTQPQIGATVSFPVGTLEIQVSGELVTAGETLLLDEFLGATSAADTFYVSLHNGSPGNDGANELSGGDYARRSTTFARSS